MISNTKLTRNLAKLMLDVDETIIQAERTAGAMACKKYRTQQRIVVRILSIDLT